MNNNDFDCIGFINAILKVVLPFIADGFGGLATGYTVGGVGANFFA